jgi:hypothetical protein
MKRLLIVALLLLAGPARADEPVTFRPLTGFILTNLTNIYVATSTKAMGSQTRWARFLCTVNCHMAVQVTPIVVTVSAPVFLQAGVPEYFIVTPGSYVIVRSDSASGALHVTEMTR